MLFQLQDKFFRLVSFVHSFWRVLNSVLDFINGSIFEFTGIIHTFQRELTLTGSDESICSQDQIFSREIALDENIRRSERQFFLI